MKSLLTGALFLALAHPALAAAPVSEITVPPGFTAEVIHEGVGPARHITVRPNGDLYISTRAPSGGEKAAEAPGTIIALRDTDGDGRPDQIRRFGEVQGGTGIRFHGGALYVASATAVYRFTFKGDELVPTAPPQVIVTGLPTGGFSNRGLAFDGAGGMFVSVGGGNNICAERPGPEAPGRQPCPDLATRAGIWKYDEKRPNQQHPADGERYATGVRDLIAVDWDPRTHALYAVVHGRNGVNRAWPKLFTALDDAEGVAEELHRVDRGADLGWPYTYYDGRTHQRMLAPEYGGDGKTAAPAGRYSEPLVAIPPHSSPLDIVFYQARQFPSAYRGGAFIVLQGGADRAPLPAEGYDVKFVSAPGAGKPVLSDFAEGFAGAPPTVTQATARYRPSGAAVAPDGSLYILDTKLGRIWRVRRAGR
jgi:glucose/arabinose dehydrogenase